MSGKIILAHHLELWDWGAEFHAARWHQLSSLLIFFNPRNGLRREGGTRSLILKFFYHRYYKNASSSLSSSISRNKFTNQFLYRCDKLYLPACTGFNRLFTVRCRSFAGAVARYEHKSNHNAEQGRSIQEHHFSIKTLSCFYSVTMKAIFTSTFLSGKIHLHKWIEWYWYE